MSESPSSKSPVSNKSAPILIVQEPAKAVEETAASINKKKTKVCFSFFMHFVSFMMYFLVDFDMFGFLWSLSWH